MSYNVDRMSRVVRVHYLHTPLPAPVIPIQPEPWMDAALCAQVDPELFYPEKGGSPVAAKKVCAGCDVKTECLAYALLNNEHDGVWGGMTRNERRRMRRAS